MDRYTAASIGQNLTSLADAFLDFNNPEKQAKAALVRLSAEEARLRNEGLGIENKYSPLRFQAGIDLDRARIGTESAQQGYYGAQAGRANSETDLNKLKLDAGRQLIGGGGGTVPFTTYSTGADAGGQDEMQDSWTNRGYTATGKNLSDGVVAVDPSVYPLGTIFQSDRDGNVYVAADVHGNGNPQVVDFYRPPGSYAAESGQAPLRVVGRESLPYGTSAEEIAALRDKYARLSNVFGGGGANDLALATARNAMLSASDEQAGRNAAAAISGNLPGAGEHATAAGAEAYQRRGIEGDLAAEQLRGQLSLAEALQVEGVKQTGENQRTLAEIVYGGQRSMRAGASGGGDTISGVSMVKPVHEMIGQRFGMSDESGNVSIAPDLRGAAGAWQTTFANLVDHSVSPAKAEVIADQHHNVGAVGKEDPWFGDARIVAGKGFNFTPMMPEEAMQFAPALVPPGTGAPELGSIFGMAPEQAASAQPTAPTPQTGTPLVEAPKAAVLTGRRLGVERKQAEAAADREEDKAWNRRTLQYNQDAFRLSGLTPDDLMASLFSGDKDDELAVMQKLERTGRLFVYDPDGIRNALLDNDVAREFGIDPVKAYQFKMQGSKPATPTVRRYNPATGQIE